MEKWDAYTRDGIRTEVELTRGEPIPEGLYHLVCEVLVRHVDGSYLCMKRSMLKPNYPGYYEATAGGSALKDEDKLQCVKRELEEETGYKAGKMEHLVDIFTTVAFCDEKISMYVASELIPSKQNLDENEFLNVETHSIESLIQMIYEGKIQDSKTIVGLMTYYHKYCK